MNNEQRPASFTRTEFRDPSILSNDDDFPFVLISPQDLELSQDDQCQVSQNNEVKPDNSFLLASPQEQWRGEAASPKRVKLMPRPSRFTVDHHSETKHLLMTPTRLRMTTCNSRSLSPVSTTELLFPNEENAYGSPFLTPVRKNPPPLQL